MQSTDTTALAVMENYYPVKNEKHCLIFDSHLIPFLLVEQEIQH
jgi:hypothetical protein